MHMASGSSSAGRALFAEGARTFFVARLDEALRLRSVLPDATIYVLDGLLNGMVGDVSAFVSNNIRPVIGSIEDLREWRNLHSRSRPPAALQIDTGMNRLGVPLTDIAAAGGAA